MRIRNLVAELCKAYGTRDPFELARLRNIILLYDPLGDIQGYYSKSLRQKFIHINQDLEELPMRFTCAHELGHSVLHPNTNTPFLRAETLFSVDRLEIEANRFAVNLLFTDEELEEIAQYPVEQIACAMGVPSNLAEYRMRGLQTRLC